MKVKALTYNIRRINPDQTQSTMSYNFGTNNWGKKNFLTTQVDENSQTSKILTDVKQQKTRIEDALGNTTHFKYNALGQLLESIDPETHSTNYTYDDLGRLTERNHPSAGTTQYEYDNASNMLKQTMSSGEEISYTYNYNQLTNVNYSNKPWNNVLYKYGLAGSGR